MAFDTKNDRAAVLHVIPFATGTLSLEDMTHLGIWYRADFPSVGVKETLAFNSWIRLVLKGTSTVDISDIDEASAVNVAEKRRSTVTTTLEETSTI